VLVLLGLALVGLATTAWVQSRPAAQKRGAAGLNPWEVDFVDLKDSVVRGRLPHLTWGRWALGGVVAFSLLFGLAGAYVLATQWRPAAPGPAGAAGPAIAVLPFRVVGPDADLWSEGMVDLFHNNLDGVAGLRAIDPRVVLSRWRAEMGEGAESGDPARALRVARQVGASFALLGDMVGSTSAVRIAAELHDLRSGALFRAQVEGPADSVLSLVDLLSLEIVRGGLLSDSTQALELAQTQVTTWSLPALRAFLEGERKFRLSRFREAIADYSRAVEADSAFALAYYRIAECYGWVDPFSPRTAQYSQRAEELAERLPERARLLLGARAGLESFRPYAINLLEEFTARYPDDVQGWFSLADVYYHVGDRVPLPRERAKRGFERALSLDPGFSPAYIHLIDFALLEQDSAEVRRLIERHRAIDSLSAHARGFSLAWALTWGDSAARASASGAADTLEADVLVSAFARLFWSGNFYPEESRTVARALLDPRHPGAARRFGQVLMTRSLLGEGRVRAAHDSTAAIWARLGSDPQGRALAINDLTWYLNGYRDPAFARRAAAVLEPDPGPNGRFYLGALAATLGQWPEVEAQLRAIETVEQELAAAGEAERASDVRALATGLRGYAALLRDDAAGARRYLAEALPALGHPQVQGLLRYEYARLLLAAGELEEAQRYFESLEYFAQLDAGALTTTPSEYYLGLIHEQRGDRERAGLHYARFVHWWENADPELQPLVELGREALERLAGEPRG
jgi:tetratricopeptide (TPR) repeat protein